jgi:hypothetical protein
MNYFSYDNEFMKSFLPLLLILLSFQSLEAKETFIRELFDHEKLYMGAEPNKSMYLIDVDMKVTNKGVTFALNDFSFDMPMKGKEWEAVKASLPTQMPFVSSVKQFSSKHPEEAFMSLFLGLRFYELYLQKQLDENPKIGPTLEGKFKAAQQIKDATFYHLMAQAHVTE